MSNEFSDGTYYGEDGLRNMLKATIENADELRLCFVSDRKLYFTDAPNPNDDLHHDDWDDGYDTAGLYGANDPYQLVKVMYSGPVQEANYKQAPEDIISGRLEWLTSDTFADEAVDVCALSPLTKTIEAIQRAGGQAYLPADEQ